MRTQDEIIFRLNIRGEVGTPLPVAEGVQAAFAGQALESRFLCWSGCITSMLPPEVAGYRKVISTLAPPTFPPSRAESCSAGTWL